MPFKQTHDPDVMENKVFIVPLFIFGIPFFLVGGFLVLSSLGLGDADGAMPWRVGVPMGGVFALVGLAAMTFRNSVVMDRRRETIVSSWRVLVFGHAKERSLGEATGVTIHREVRSTQKSSYTVYPVRIACEGKPVNLDESRDYQQARATAEQIAKFLRLPVVDSSSGEEVVREHDELDDSLRDQAERSGEAVHVPDLPQGTKIQYQIDGAELSLILPPKGVNVFSFLKFGLLIAPVIFLCVLAAMI